MTDLFRRMLITGIAAAGLLATSCTGASEDEGAAMPHPSKVEPIKYIYVVPSSHLDIGFTDTPEHVAATRAENLSDVLTYCADHPDFRWTEEQGWGVHQWLKMNEGNTKELERLRAALRSGQVSIGATYVNAHARLMGNAVGLLTCLDPLLKKELGYSPKVAIQNDVPDVPPAVVDALFERGVKYLLLGPNNSFTASLAEPPADTPIYLRGYKHRLLTFIDNDGYTAAFAAWGIDPDSARLFAKRKFGSYTDDLALMKAGIDEQVGKLVARGYPYDAVVVQHAFDNWTPDAAKSLPKFAKLWNESVGTPKIIIARPEEFFDHIARTYRGQMPTYGGEWGGSWDAIRASIPQTTDRLMAAANALASVSAPPLDKASAMAAAFDHNISLGPTWPGNFDEDGCVQHNAQVAAILAQAIAAGSDAAGLGAPPFEPPMFQLPGPLLDPDWSTPLSGPLGSALQHSADNPATLTHVLADCELKDSPRGIGPALAPDAKPLDVIQKSQWMKDGILPWSFAANVSGRKYQVLWDQNDDSINVWATVDRSALPQPESGATDMSYGWVFRLGVPPSDLTVSLGDGKEPVKWLIGRTPPLITAPEGLTLRSPAFKLRVKSSRLFVYSLVPDPNDSQATLLMIQDFIQNLTVTLKGGEKKAMPFTKLYPGEPSTFEGEFEIYYSEPDQPAASRR